MTTAGGTVVSDLVFLLGASKKLHGYLLHTWFKHYLDVIAGNMRRWAAYGLVGPDGRPNEAARHSLLFDIDALNIEKITYILGFYLYILASHKKANFTLMKGGEKKRVLYLRGFDYESAVYAGGGLAMSFESVDTMRFTHKLGARLHPEFEVFTAMSPRDLFWETGGVQRYFHGDYGRLVDACSYPIRSIYLNANHWQADVSELADRVDYFVVYVSSITESLLWELELLKEKGRASDTTVVFDEKAIANKDVQTGVQEKMRETYGEKVLWSKGGAGTPLPTAEGLRESLAKDFHVVSPENFFRNLSREKARVRRASGPAGVASRDEPLPFRFYPAMDDDALRRLRDLDESVETSIAGRVSSKSIESLPLFLNNVQLKIYTSLMLGEHDKTGRALAVYAAVVDVTLRRLFAGNPPLNEAAVERDARARDVLEEHLAMASYASQTLMGYGKSHEFGSYLENANKVYDELFASASGAVERFFDEAHGVARA